MGTIEERTKRLEEMIKKQSIVLISLTRVDGYNILVKAYAESTVQHMIHELMRTGRDINVNKLFTFQGEKDILLGWYGDAIYCREH